MGPGVVEGERGEVRVGLWVLVVLVFGPGLAGCGRDFEPLVDVEPTVTDVESLPAIEFPRDNEPHENLSEWWYFTGHLRDEEGREYGFEFVIFKGDRGREGGFSAHFAVTDGEAETFEFAERTSYLDGGRRGEGLDLCVGGWTLAGGPEAFAVAAAMPGYELDLALKPLKPASIHDEDGLLDFGEYGWSYYYSYTRMEVSGNLMTASGPVEVTGEAWMDHQWGDFVSVGSGGWDWFSLQLADGRDFTASMVRSQEGEVVLDYGTLVGADGVARHMSEADFEIEATGEWTSERSGATYPAGWRLTIPAEEIDVVLEPVLADQELDTMASTGIIYWEGAVEAMAGGVRVGRGYVELTGYARGQVSYFESLLGERVDGCAEADR